MIDNVTWIKEMRPPKELLKANGRPFIMHEVIYSPKFVNGHLVRYEGQLRNLRLYIYPEKIYLFNSVHKYWHDNNYCDFYRNEFTQAVEAIADDTGIKWKKAVVKKIEYGCNVQCDHPGLANSFLSFKGKDFQPMLYKGKKYGAAVEFDEYRIKGYDKHVQVKLSGEASLPFPLFRWEVQMNRSRQIEKLLSVPAVQVQHLLNEKAWLQFGEDAAMKFKNTTKMQQLLFHKLTPHQKRIIAEMLVPEIREDMKRHHKETYKRDRRIYSRIMKSKEYSLTDNMAERIAAKMKDLATIKQEQEKPLSRLVI